MYNVKKVHSDLYWIGGNDRRITLFENIFPLLHGVSYNSYILLDEKVVVFDSVDKSIADRFFENIEQLLDGRMVDYIVVNHVEPDHCGTILELTRRYVNMKIICTAKAKSMIQEYFHISKEEQFILVQDGDEFKVGSHELLFATAPMVHWPEVMVTYEKRTKTLFSADAFGSFNALGGSLFADEYDYEYDFADESRRYYANIVGKYGPQVQALLQKQMTLEVECLCPLHGPVWRQGIESYVEKYQKWSNYEPEEVGVVIAYGSIYGNTENAIEILATQLVRQGFKKVKLMDVSRYHSSYIVAEVFKYSHIVFASSTYNGGIFLPMNTLLHDLKSLNLQNRTVAIVENGSWAVTSGKQMVEIISSMKNMNILEHTLSIQGTLKEEQLASVEVLAKNLVESI